MAVEGQEAAATELVDELSLPLPLSLLVELALLLAVELPVSTAVYPVPSLLVVPFVELSPLAGPLLSPAVTLSRREPELPDLLSVL